ncbi:MAG: universal stress protein [Pirellulaceae bacterium]
MALITRILCPTDFSETAQQAFQYADQLAAQLQAELLVLHAFDKPAALTAAGQSIPADPHLRDRLDAITSAHGTTQVQRLLHVGAPGEVICWLANHQHCDLIVLGTHGRTGLRHLVLGSVAEYVVRHARCPVLTLRMTSSQEPLPKEPRVLPVPAPRLM